MSASPPESFSEVIKKNVKRILTYWTQITVSLGLLATGIGFLSLYAYTRSIGRSDLFMPSIDVKSALVVWVVIVMLGLAGYLLMLSVTTWLFGTAISMFKDIPDEQLKIAFTLLIPTIAGFGAFEWMLFFKPGLLNTNVSVMILLSITTILCLTIYALTQFKLLIKKSIITTHTIARNRRKTSSPYTNPTPDNQVKKFKARLRAEKAAKAINKIIKKYKFKIATSKIKRSYLIKTIKLLIKKIFTQEVKNHELTKSYFLQAG